MNNINLAEKKILLAKKIFALNDINKITQIQVFVNKLLDLKKYDAKTIGFYEWNEQFEDNLKLEEFIPEYGMSLKDFRLKIYNAEKEDGISKDEFLGKLNNLK